MPTILAAADVDVPDEIEGRLVSELFEQPPAMRRERQGKRMPPLADGRKVATPSRHAGATPVATTTPRGPAVSASAMRRPDT